MSGPNTVASRYTDNAMVDFVVVICRLAAMVVIAGAIICRQGFGSKSRYERLGLEVGSVAFPSIQ